MARSVVLLAGATATGKSELALRMARADGSVIVNADSQQLYDGLQILSAGPSAEDEALAPHRLFGIADPGTAWSTGEWLRAVQAIMAEEARPLVIVGGTGLYFHALTNGLAPTPPVDASVRDELIETFDTEGEVAFRRRLAAVDPQADARIAAGDRQRLVRALAVALSTGRALTAWQADTAPSLLRDAEVTSLVLERDRATLYGRCDRRVDAMIEAGALQEVEALMSRGLSGDLPAMKAVGVRELGAYLRAAVSLDEARDRMKMNTRRYAKRQLTWFRNQMPSWQRVVAD